MELITLFVWLLMAMDVLAITDRHDRKRNRGEDRNTTSPEEIFQTVLRRSQYSKSDPPMLDKPTEVKIGIYVNSFYDISEQTMDYSVSMYLRQSWQDKRLEFASLEDKLTKIRLGENSWNKIWIPDTFFRNEKGAEFHTVTVNNRLLTLNSSGFLWYVTKISAKLACPMRLEKYPLDTQHCPMMFESFGYTMDTMYFSWLPSPVDIDPNVQLPQFTLKDQILYDCSQNYSAGRTPVTHIQAKLNTSVSCPCDARKKIQHDNKNIVVSK